MDLTRRAIRDIVRAEDPNCCLPIVDAVRRSAREVRRQVDALCAKPNTSPDTPSGRRMLMAVIADLSRGGEESVPYSIRVTLMRRVFGSLVGQAQRDPQQELALIAEAMELLRPGTGRCEIFIQDAAEALGAELRERNAGALVERFVEFALTSRFPDSVGYWHRGMLEGLGVEAVRAYLDRPNLSLRQRGEAVEGLIKACRHWRSSGFFRRENLGDWLSRTAQGAMGQAHHLLAMGYVVESLVPDQPALAPSELSLQMDLVEQGRQLALAPSAVIELAVPGLTPVDRWSLYQFANEFSGQHPPAEFQAQVFVQLQIPYEEAAALLPACPPEVALAVMRRARNEALAALERHGAQVLQACSVAAVSSAESLDDGPFSLARRAKGPLYADLMIAYQAHADCYLQSDPLAAIRQGGAARQLEWIEEEQAQLPALKAQVGDPHVIDLIQDFLAYFRDAVQAQDAQSQPTPPVELCADDFITRHDTKGSPVDGAPQAPRPDSAEPVLLHPLPPSSSRAPGGPASGPVSAARDTSAWPPGHGAADCKAGPGSGRG